MNITQCSQSKTAFQTVTSEGARLIYIYRYYSKMTKIGHFATRFLTKPKEMGTIWTSRFEDKSLYFIAVYL